DRPLPTTRGNGILMRLAGNEAEAAQLVLRPSRPLGNFSAACNGLAGPDGAIIPAEATQVLRVRYVPVAFPTDTTGVAAPWPDPLPPFRGPIDVPAGENQPLWIRVTTPKNLPGGLYKGAVELRADGYSASVPIEVRVYNFSLPDRMTCETAFGLSPGNVFRYHGLTTRDQQRLVLDKYLENMSAHHISPYDPAPLDHFRVIWPEVRPGESTDAASLEVQFDWTAWDAAMEKAFDEYHFNTYRTPTVGTNFGRQSRQRTPSIQGFRKGAPEYKTLFYNYHHGLQEHLREKGWLDYAYFYWFDEPEPEDYPIVMEGFRMLREAAPEIRRMLTEQVEPELVGGPNLWCPYTRPYNHERAEARRQHGDQFWWYVCTVPKAPYCGLFIDHPATEMRVWLWQTWQRNIDGILVWETTYWTSPTAYPDHPQNPYEDPMGWVSAGERAKGVRTPWGNGDGRFMYPPEAAADARPAGPVLDGPVDSIRFEMLRDGIEDYEYLAILKRLLNERGGELSARKRRKYEALLEVPPEITSDMVTFAKDPAPIEKQRRKIAKTIEALLSE
ncbi:MAG TPA: DUF4091 domain-containing protein, partial [Candidatus Hydrogenedentes bacterium]|nr:DUF4091 domain-containing protein [Candidatus Hydrogenedentota bacterium]